MTESQLSGRAAELRLAFDRGFAEPYPADPPASEDLLEIALGEAGYALRLAEIAEIVADRPIVALPGKIPALLGLAGRRGGVVPVYDLAILLGQARQEAPRWLAVAAARPVAFAFTALAGYRRLARDAIVPQAADPAAPGLVRDLARLPGLHRPIVSLDAALDAAARLAAEPSR